MTTYLVMLRRLRPDYSLALRTIYRCQKMIVAFVLLFDTEILDMAAIGVCVWFKYLWRTESPHLKVVQECCLDS